MYLFMNAYVAAYVGGLDTHPAHPKGYGCHTLFSIPITIIVLINDMYKWIYIIYYMSQSDMAKYFMSRLIYFQEPEASENTA